MPNKIIDLIAKQSSWSFSDFMALALYHERFGYYMQPGNPIGSDYITGPERSKAIAYSCAVAWCKLAQPVLCEIGPGSGRLMFDILQFLYAWDKLPEQIWLIELNQHRQQQQQALLAELPVAVSSRCDWFTVVPKQEWSGMLLGHEVLDAQPFDIAEFDGYAWFERQVVATNGKLFWQLAKEHDLCLPDIKVSEGYKTEIHSKTPAFIAQACAGLTCGGVLFIDYGYSAAEYYHPQRYNGASKIFFDNRSSDNLLSDPGACDITSHVNFSLVRNSLFESGFTLKGFFTQGQFLIHTKANEHLLDLSGADYHKANFAFKSLLFDMGDVFKVMLAARATTAWDIWLSGYGIDRLD